MSSLARSSPVRVFRHTEPPQAIGRPANLTNGIAAPLCFRDVDVMAATQPQEQQQKEGHHKWKEKSTDSRIH